MENKTSTHERDTLLSSITRTLKEVDDLKLWAIYLFVLHIQ